MRKNSTDKHARGLHQYKQAGDIMRCKQNSSVKAGALNSRDFLKQLRTDIDVDRHLLPFHTNVPLLSKGKCNKLSKGKCNKLRDEFTQVKIELVCLTA